jgi:hypothetical protein
MDETKTTKMLCDDCTRKNNIPAVGPTHYVRCEGCKIIRACYGIEVES